MTDQDKENNIVKKGLSPLADRTKELRELSSENQREIFFRSLLPNIPIAGPLIDQFYFGTREKHQKEKIRSTIDFLKTQVAHIEQELPHKLENAYFSSPEFASLWESCWKTLLAEEQAAKLQALRGALLNVLLNTPNIPFEKRASFIQSLDQMSSVGIHILQIYQEKRMTNQVDIYTSMEELYSILNSKEESSQDFIYFTIDVLANRRFIVHGNVPQGDEGVIDHFKQRFALTALGSEFLEFIRSTEIEPN